MSGYRLVTELTMIWQEQRLDFDLKSKAQNFKSVAFNHRECHYESIISETRSNTSIRKAGLIYNAGGFADLTECHVGLLK
jgi:hypothetical protein